MATMKVKATLDSRNYKRGVKEMKRETKGFGKGLKAISGKMKAVFAVGAIAAVVGAIKSLTTAAFDATGQLVRMSEQAGVSVENLQKLATAVLDSAEDTDTLRDALGAIKTAQGEVLRGDEGMLKEFEALGISIDEIAALDVDELFARIGQAMKETGNDAARFSALAKIIGEGDALKLQTAFDAAAGGLENLDREMGSLSEAQAAQVEASRRWLASWRRYITNFWAVAISKIARTDDEVAALLESRQKARESQAERRAQMLEALKKKRAEERLKEIEKEAAARRKIDEQRSQRMKAIRESVKIEIDTNAIARIGGFAGSAVKDTLRLARQRTETQEKIAEYTASLPRIEANTSSRGLK